MYSLDENGETSYLLHYSKMWINLCLISSSLDKDGDTDTDIYLLSQCRDEDTDTDSQGRDEDRDTHSQGRDEDRDTDTYQSRDALLAAGVAMCHRTGAACHKCNPKLFITHLMYTAPHFCLKKISLWQIKLFFDGVHWHWILLFAICKCMKRKGGPWGKSWGPDSQINC